LNSKKMPMRSHESILVFYDSPPTYNPQMTTGHEPMHYAVNSGTVNVYGKSKCLASDRIGKTDRMPRSIIRFPVVNNTDRIHPSEKPVALFEYLIKTFTNKGDLVLDNCAGSLVTALAAQNTGRKFICIEKEMEYIAKAMPRLEDM
jgi:DNA modification methylase